jgi:hypothetical protein
VLLFFGLPNAGVELSGFVASWLALTLVLMAFSEEIFWAGITSVPKGQWEAARSTGLGFVQTLAYVVLPQALRITIPPLTNRTIAITKGTALGLVVGGAGHPRPGECRRVLLLQPLAADARRDRLPGAVLPRRRARPLDRDALRVEEVTTMRSRSPAGGAEERSVNRMVQIMRSRSPAGGAEERSVNRMVER